MLSALPRHVGLASACVASACAGYMVRELLQRMSARREAEAMRVLGEKEAIMSEASSTDGDAFIECTRGVGRKFGVRQSDTALVLIDMQVDFLHEKGRLGRHYDAARLKSLEATQAKVEQLLTAARHAGLTIAHSRSHRYGGAVRRDLLEGAQPGHPGDLTATTVGAQAQHFNEVDQGYEIVPRLRALPGEIVVDKWTFGAFASTDLEQQLRQRGVRRILLCGILTNVCVFATAVQACDRLCARLWGV